MQKFALSIDEKNLFSYLRATVRHRKLHYFKGFGNAQSSES